MTRIVLLAIAACALAFATARPSYAAERYLDEVFPSVSVTSNIAYGQAIDEYGQLETLRLDLYQPAGDTLAARPVLVFIHGGGFTGGDKSNVTAVAFVTSFARRGYVTASINYRLREAGFPPADQASVILDAQHDAQAAIRWFRANAATYAIDDGRISISGYSAGAVTALFVAYNSSDPGGSGNPGSPSDVSAVIDVSGALNDSLMEAGEPPMMIAHGTNDATVPYSEAQELVARAQEVGVPYELHALVGEGHGIFAGHLNEIIGWSSGFLYQYVIGAGAAVGGIADVPLIGGARSGARGGVTMLEGLLVLAAGAAAASWARQRTRRR